jgi:hypothetical protein
MPLHNATVDWKGQSHDNFSVKNCVEAESSWYTPSDFEPISESQTLATGVLEETTSESVMAETKSHLVLIGASMTDSN